MYCSLTWWTRGGGAASRLDYSFINPDLKMALRGPDYSLPNRMMGRGERVAFPLMYVFVAAVGVVNCVGIASIRGSNWVPSGGDGQP
jgi:hypothetical protein